MAFSESVKREWIFCRNCGEMVHHRQIGWRYDGPPRDTGPKLWRRWARQKPTKIPVYACEICNCRVSPDLNERGF